MNHQVETYFMAIMARYDDHTDFFLLSAADVYAETHFETVTEQEFNEVINTNANRAGRTLSVYNSHPIYVTDEFDDEGNLLDDRIIGYQVEFCFPILIAKGVMPVNLETVDYFVDDNGLFFRTIDADEIPF